MPTYQYECRACGHAFEQVQSIKAAPLRRCPKCRGAVKRLIGTGGGLLFRGSGFYITDYRSSSYKEQAKKEKGDAAPSVSSGSGKAEAATPATKKASTAKTD